MAARRSGGRPAHAGGAFARHAHGPYVLKLSSWNTLYCDVVAEAFPETPWVLSLRDPVEVGVSLLASPPGWFQGTAEAARGLVAQVDPGHAAKSREEFVARAYGAFCAAAAGLDASRGRLVPYESLPAAVWRIVAPHFSLSIDPRNGTASPGRAAACKGASRNGRGIHLRRGRQAGRRIGGAASGDRFARTPATRAPHADCTRTYNAAVKADCATAAQEAEALRAETRPCVARCRARGGACGLRQGARHRHGGARAGRRAPGAAAQARADPDGVCGGDPRHSPPRSERSRSRSRTRSCS